MRHCDDTLLGDDYSRPAQGKWNLEPIRQGARALSHFDTNPFHYDFATFEWICEGTGLTPEYWGDWQTPKNQKMIVFTKA
jgi:hypothetical protein